ncbi:hypothetical protein [Streptomyces niveus]|uniref:hypothetical protein n=1 Tax=Streptomyces niveus TaxID=193462 RepID=UPI0003C6316B|nr:hypothetical protein [Streptomyces niveus]EST22787.1 hypothetical protein M877_28840 [Streptomyces niveus NCIMB 11891]
MAKRIEHPAGGKFMTLDELAAFVADAYACGATGHETVLGKLSLLQKLQKIEVTIETTADAE